MSSSGGGPFFNFGEPLVLGAHQGGHATPRLLEGFLDGSLLLRRVLRRRLVRASKETEVLRCVLRRGGVIEGAEKPLRRQKHALSQSTTPFACTLLIVSRFLEGDAKKHFSEKKWAFQ